ncbi:SNF2 family N-terminal domain-containing protein [Multifurca ochricompacta]|uniref:Chromatin-remodeling ATPase INO80 n=1 Tax=Multifurca ochricompacta TaxID=376703 RepID=A0AAD4MFB0_9AGAM|nr:SNF2 family N-terminal domain-containing protein [Multifurca ochricompacta]
MSLSRILNDHPAPAPATVTSVPVSQVFSNPPPPNSLIPSRHDPSPSPPFPSRSQTPLSRQVQSSPAQERRTNDFAPRSGGHQDTSAWDPDTREWRQSSRPWNGNTEMHREVSPSSIQDYRYGKNEEPNAVHKKRKRAVDDDGDYRPPSTRRHASRRQPPRGRHIRAQSPPLDSSEPEVVAPALREPTEEELRLVSSDLSDCEDIWYTEIGYYMLETRRRRRMVEEFFETNVVESNMALMSALSGRYAAVLEKIPVFVPQNVREPQPQSVEDELLSTLRQISPGDDRRDDNRSPTMQRFHGQENGAEDAARELEESVLGSSTPSKGKRKSGETKKHSYVASDPSSSDLDIPIARDQGRANKRRKLRKDSDITADLERSIAEDQRSVASAQDVQKPAPSVKAKRKGKARQGIREHSVDSVSATPKASRKRPAARRKLDAIAPQTLESLGLGSAPASIAGDLTPGGSRPPSPTLTATSATVFEMDTVIPPLKKAKKVDDATMLKRIKALEETQRKVWKNIARREIPKVYKYCAMGYQQRQVQYKRVATLASLQARRPYSRTPKATKDVQAKSKRLMREMLVFWKKNEKEERDVRKRENKEAADRAKIEEEKREAARQARKLEFLINQTELYSHFVGNKLKTAEIQGEAPNTEFPTGADFEDRDPAALAEIDFDDADHTNLHRHARHNAQEAMMLAKKRVQAFDAQVALERKTNQALQLAKSQAHVRDDEEERQQSAMTPLVDLDSDELNFQNPTSLSGPLTIAQPRMLMAQLKEYQLKGLNWLATLYDQGINGILADEMGLGKTVQSISLLAYLAETHDIWGPFLVVAPASTLHNWQQELTRFVPKLKALPYWGNVKDRATLRKFWSRKEITYNRDTPFHVVITSYQLVTQDQQYFQRVKWQYMVLDEAQNIKNAASVRWKTLLGFHCRNRLLLTGTPIQNSMQELWALLHFIMPTLFDSHDEFNEWFSKDIENAAENKGSKLNEHQLRRLHMILRPFMLRRVKRNVQNELSDKIEKDIYVDLSARQRAMYKALQANVSIADLLEKAANIGDADSARSLMNLVMQFRKVCNHPELFERADVVAPYSFTEFGRSGPLNRQGDFVMGPYSTRNPIEYSIPELLYLDGGLKDVPFSGTGVTLQPDQGILHKLMNIWTTDWIQHSLMNDVDSPFSFLSLLDMAPSAAHELYGSPILRRCLLALEEERTQNFGSDFFIDDEHRSSGTRLILPRHRRLLSPSVFCLPSPHDIASSSWFGSLLSRQGLRWFVPPVVAPPITMYCPNRTFVEHQVTLLDAPFESLALYGLTPALNELVEPSSLYTQLVPGVPPTGLIVMSSRDQIPGPKMQVPEAKSLICDSAKLARLDSLLQELKVGDHRVLIYFQMTRMMDLMEEYLIYRQYKYLRLDGSSKLEDRRDMVMDWQTRPDIFIFILSTRAGGLGINLTAADTVIFYDHDWNPSNDAQAMDRAHRLGQTRQVTVYRLITKGTIDERIVQLARVKKDVQDIVVGNKTFTDATKPSEIVQLLLNEDQLASLDSSSRVPGTVSADTAVEMSKASATSTRDLWAEEGDEFFGHLDPVQSGPQDSGKDNEDGTGTPKPARGGKRSKTGATNPSHGRKVTAKGGSKRKSAMGNKNVSTL